MLRVSTEQMIERLTRGFLALAMLLSSGLTGATSYLCSMDGKVRSECCCKKAQADSDCPQVPTIMS